MSLSFIEGIVFTVIVAHTDR